MDLRGLNTSTARQVIESLRWGIPPNGYVRYFTVGRSEEIHELEDKLRREKFGTLLVQANYGAGKSHLLQFAGEIALDYGYIVSYVVVDSNGGVRFNRMDQIAASILKGIQIPNLPRKSEFEGVIRHYLCKVSELNSRRDRYEQSWDYLNKLHRRSRDTYGFKGLVVLFDEFEDVLTSLRNINYQDVAFQNLFKFYNGIGFRGMSFFAVTPEFCRTAKRRMMGRYMWSTNEAYDKWNMTYEQLEQLPTFQMSPITVEQLQELSKRICKVYEIAYKQDTSKSDLQSDLKNIIEILGCSPIQDRSRQAIIQIVECLDSYR